MTIKPHILPKDGVDWVIMPALVFPIQALGLFILPGVTIFTIFMLVLSGRILPPLPLIYSMLLGLITPVIVYIIFLMFTVWSINVSEKGITFYRFLGFPKKLRWDLINDISPASRIEVIQRGWLWPLLPAREMTPTLSSLGHYRISWDGGYCYFPPSSAKIFEAEVNKYIKQKC